MKFVINFILISAVIVSIIFLTSCGNTDKKMSYDQFIMLAEDINKNLNIPNFINLEGNQGPQLVAIEKELAFDKRQYLTLDGEANDQVTQKRIEFKSNDNTYLAVIDVIYLDKVLNNDLIFWSYPLENNKENEFLRKTFVENILSYKNCLIKISLIAVPNYTIDDIKLTEFTKHVSKYLKKYEIK